MYWPLAKTVVTTPRTVAPLAATISNLAAMALGAGDSPSV